MPTERDELRLTVTLVDNVSAGLNKIKGEFKDLTEGSGKRHAEKFKKENAEATAVLKRMGGEAGEVYKAFGMMRLGALGAAGGVALLGFEIAKQIKEWGELADKIRGTSQVGRLFGIKPEDLRNIQEQLEAFGVSAELSMGALTKFMDRMGEMQRNPAMRADILRGVIRDPGRRAGDGAASRADQRGYVGDRETESCPPTRRGHREERAQAWRDTRARCWRTANARRAARLQPAAADGRPAKGPDRGAAESRRSTH